MEPPFSSSLLVSVTSPRSSNQWVPFSTAYATAATDSLLGMSLMQQQRLEPQGHGDFGSHHRSNLDRHQLQTSQSLNHDDRSSQTIPYPPRWFRVASEGNAQLPPFESMSTSNNQLPGMMQGSLPLPGLVASSAVDAFMPSSQYRNEAQASDVPPIVSAAAAVNFGAFRYTADGNPFEPVPIAENVSLRHAQSRQEEK
jgi:hypothetical protein